MDENLPIETNLQEDNPNVQEEQEIPLSANIETQTILTKDAQESQESDQKEDKHVNFTSNLENEEFLKPVTASDISSKGDASESTSKPLSAFEETFVKSREDNTVSHWFNKNYLGGYKRRDGLEFFNATTQTTTPQEIRAMRPIVRYHRDTQTIETRNRKSQSNREKYTQMTGTGVYVAVEKDKLLKPGKYTSAQEYHEMVQQKVLARIKTKNKRLVYQQRLQAVKEKEQKRLEKAEKKRLKDVEARLHPSRVKDFEVLYHGLEKWRIQETERINSLKISEPARKAALADLMDQESALLQKIDKLKISATEENKDKAILRLLNQMASPKQWLCRDKKYAYVDTPYTIRARELRDLYHALNLPMLSVDERLQILLHVKYTTKEFDCNLTRDIVELIDREGLRKRISSLFLQFIKTPEFNPEAIHHQKVLTDNKQMAVYYCKSCTCYKPSTEFCLSTTIKLLGKCRDCTDKQNVAFERQSERIYEDMLKYVQLNESKQFNNHAKIFNAMSLLQASDMRYLIDVIWNKKSIISSSAALEELVLTRWDAKEECSPWNCILLTRSEQVAHDAIQKLDTYSLEFQQKVKHKHILARRHFETLPAIGDYLRDNYYEDENGKLVRK